MNIDTIEEYIEVLEELSQFEFGDDYHAEDGDYYIQRKIDLIAAKESFESEYPELVSSIQDEFGMPF